VEPRSEPPVPAPRPPPSLPATATTPAPSTQKGDAERPAVASRDDIDREQLREALVELLVEAARQEGLEV